MSGVHAISLEVAAKLNLVPGHPEVCNTRNKGSPRRGPDSVGVGLGAHYNLHPHVVAGGGGIARSKEKPGLKLAQGHHENPNHKIVKPSNRQWTSDSKWHSKDPSCWHPDQRGPNPESKEFGPLTRRPP